MVYSLSTSLPTCSLHNWHRDNPTAIYPNKPSHFITLLKSSINPQITEDCAL